MTSLAYVASLRGPSGLATPVALAAVDLNAVVAPGLYTLNTNAIAQACTNQPLSSKTSTGVAGQLTVTNSEDGRGVYQAFLSYENESFHRVLHPRVGGSWTPWVSEPSTAYGTYANRPAASAVQGGFIYICSDVPEMYRSNGTSWTVFGSAGQELGYAESASRTDNATVSYTDVVGVATTFKVGERPVKIVFNGMVANSSATGLTYVGIYVDGVEKGRGQMTGIGVDIWQQFHLSARVAGLTPGTTHTAKVMMKCGSTASTARVGGENATAPASIQVVTL